MIALYYFKKYLDMAPSINSYDFWHILREDYETEEKVLQLMDHLLSDLIVEEYHLSDYDQYKLYETLEALFLFTANRHEITSSIAVKCILLKYTHIVAFIIENCNFSDSVTKKLIKEMVKTKIAKAVLEKILKWEGMKEEEFLYNLKVLFIFKDTLEIREKEYEELFWFSLFSLENAKNSDLIESTDIIELMKLYRINKPMVIVMN